MFIPDTFEVPESVTLGDFRLRMLSIDDLEEDYRAVMESVEDLQGVFGERDKWPEPGLDKRQDLIDLGWHEKEFQIRSSFAYVVEDAGSQKYLGCIYIFPSPSNDCDAEVYGWLRSTEYSKQRQQELKKLVRFWLQSWPFEKICFPGTF